MDNKDDEMINVYRGNENPQEVKLSDFRAEFGKYMQSDNLNFLFGSGCSSLIMDSKQLGIDTMAGLYSQFKKENPNFEICKKKLDNPDFDNNLERLLDILISLKEVKEYVDIDEEPADKIKEVQNFIKKKITDNLDSEDSKEVVKLYKQFYIRTIRKSRKHPISIATTNYDLYNELALDSLGFFYNDGFSGTYKRKYNPLVYSYIYANSMKLDKNIWDRVDNFFNLFKIHGSVSWEKEGSEIYEKDPKNIETENVMIYPTPLKDRSTLMVPYSDLFRNFKDRLSSTNSVLITLGYSFGDDHINRVIFDSLSVPTFKLIIFGETTTKDKKATNILKLLKDVQDPRITVINSEDKIQYFDNFIHKVMPEPLLDVKENEELTDSIKNVRKILQESNQK